MVSKYKSLTLWAFFTLIPAIIIGFRLGQYLKGYFHPRNEPYLGPALVMIGLPGTLLVLFLVGLFLYQVKKAHKA